MNDLLDEFRSLRNRGTHRAIWMAAGLSLLVHIAVLWGLPSMRLPSPGQPEWVDPSRSLSVNLVPPAPPPLPAAPADRAQPPSAPRARSPQPARPPPAPPVIALKPPSPRIPAPVPMRPPVADDLSSYIEAQRRARAERASLPAAPAQVAPRIEEDEDVRRDRIAAANLASPRAPAFGYDPRRAGGAFQIQRLGVDHAEFMFYGWDREARRNLARLIEVNKGAHDDIRVAVVRSIISIIRDFEQGDFLWESSRLGRSLMLSARARDNAGLEDFMMREFFTEAHPLR